MTIIAVNRCRTKILTQAPHLIWAALVRTSIELALTGLFQWRGWRTWLHLIFLRSRRVWTIQDVSRSFETTAPQFTNFKVQHNLQLSKCSPTSRPTSKCLPSQLPSSRLWLFLSRLQASRVMMKTKPCTKARPMTQASLNRWRPK